MVINEKIEKFFNEVLMALVQHECWLELGSILLFAQLIKPINYQIEVELNEVHENFS